MAKGSEVMQIVFSMKSRVEIMAIHYCMLELVFFKVLSHTDTVHVAEDASESAFIRYPGADEIHVVAGSPQNSLYMYMYITFVHYACYEVMTSLDFSSHDMTQAGYGYCSKLMYS